jgi:hypothetical protein
MDFEQRRREGAKNLEGRKSGNGPRLVARANVDLLRIFNGLVLPANDGIHFIP